LSGGLDSSIIYAISKEMMGKDVTTFTIDNAEDQKYVSMLNPVNLEFLNFGNVTEEKVLQANEGPVDLGSMEAQYLIGEAIRAKGFDVALSGDGADELFGGYRRITKYDSQKSDVWSELVNYHLPRLDKMMMQHTVELRSPFLARPVVESALGLPYEWRTNKNILKYAFEDILPEEILNRKKEPLKIEGVRTDKEGHSLRLVEEWLKLERPI
jgi:asparagine synthase (glutamine-hydrolysing)